MTTKQWTNHDSFLSATIRPCPMRPQKSIRWHTSNSRHKLRRQIAQSFSRSTKNRVQEFIRRSASVRHGIANLCKTSLTLIFIRLSRLANGSSTNRRSPARRSRNGREQSHKNSDEMSHLLPHNFSAIAGRCKSQCRRISAQATREITRNTARNGLTTSASQSAHRQCKHPAR
jgi:hypothetical protein